MIVVCCLAVDIIQRLVNWRQGIGCLHLFTVDRYWWLLPVHSPQMGDPLMDVCVVLEIHSALHSDTLPLPLRLAGSIGSIMRRVASIIGFYTANIGNKAVKTVLVVGHPPIK